MKKKPFATITLVLISFVVTIMAPAFDSSVYGFNGHPVEWLSFLPSSPLRHMGASLVFSPFIHVNAKHLLTNVILFLPVALMMERKKSGLFLLKNFILVHFITLGLLFALNFIMPLGQKAFLGSSHVVVGLYVFWALANKKMTMLIFPALIFALGFWQSQNILTQVAHAFGALSGILILLFSHLWGKLRSNSSN